MRLVVVASPDFQPLSMLRADAELAVTITDDRRILPEAIADADILLVHPRLGGIVREAWPNARKLRWIHALAAGVDTLLFDELCASDVVVTNGRGIFADALAEFVAAAMLHFAKDVPRLMRQQSGRRWEPFKVERIEGKTLGIVGYGSIGRAVATLASAFRMHVVAARRQPSGDGPITPLDEVVRSADFLVVAAPLTPETRGLIGAGELRSMKRDAVLINVGRGPVVDERALVDALRERRIRGAALDVFDTEPLPPDHPLWSLDNVLLSPHCADQTPDSLQRAMTLFLENLARFRAGEPLLNVVDKQSHY